MPARQLLRSRFQLRQKLAQGRQHFADLRFFGVQWLSVAKPNGYKMGGEEWIFFGVVLLQDFTENSSSFFAELVLLCLGILPDRSLRQCWKGRRIARKWPQRESAERVEDGSIPITGIKRGRHSAFIPSANVLAEQRPSANAVTGPGGTIPLQDN